MFRNIFIFALFATCVGYAFASGLPPVWEPDGPVCGYETPCAGAAEPVYYDAAPVQDIPPFVDPCPEVEVYNGVWPAPGSDADMQLAPISVDNNISQNFAGGDENIKIVSNIGADLVVENNINAGGMFGGSRNNPFAFSGGANMTHGYPAPRGFNIYEHNAEMPLMHAEMMEDDGASVLAMSRSGRQINQERAAANARRMAVVNNISMNGAFGNMVEFGDNGAFIGNSGGGFGWDGSDIAVDDTEYAEHDAEPAEGKADQVRSWIVASGQTLRDVLQDWSNKEGWDLVWATSREYPIQASAVFKGRYLDVSSALVRNFSRANPAPHAKFYKGNRVVVVTTSGGE
ncbi:MAG: toxin co-regulated pilus biosynthesis Q family protein [Alphaproteobacteria bacterium]|nr:toxin co-regulated pilus biosynthesis Q family protein [Alphaproteobacteria bacterium]